MGNRDPSRDGGVDDLVRMRTGQAEWVSTLTTQPGSVESHDRYKPLEGQCVSTAPYAGHDMALVTMLTYRSCPLGARAIIVHSQ